jgi:hypothetical protein
MVFGGVREEMAECWSGQLMSFRAVCDAESLMSVSMLSMLMLVALPPNAVARRYGSTTSTECFA